jgi:hypothetical protein
MQIIEALSSCLSPNHATNATLAAANFQDFIRDIVFSDSRDELKELANRFFKLTKLSFQPFTHISYKVPISLGGSESDISNMELCDSLINLRFAGQVVSQVKKLAPGTKIIDVQMDRESGELKLIPEESPPD